MARTKGNIRKRPSGRFQVNWRDAFDRRHFKTFDTKKAAEAHLRKVRFEAETTAAGLLKQTNQERAWEDLIELYLKKKVGKRTLADDKIRLAKSITPILRGVKLGALGPEHVTLVQASVHRRMEAGELGPATARKYLMLLQGVLTIGKREGWIAAVPHIDKPKVPEQPFGWLRTQGEIRQLIAAAQQESYPGIPEVYATAVATGLRAGELFALQWEDINFRTGIVTVQRSWQGTTKSSKVRRVPLPHVLADRLQLWHESCPSEVLVFPTTKGTMQPRQSSRPTKQIFHRCLQRAGLPRIRFHDLRHTFASHYVMSGGDIFKLCRILGHSDVKIMMRYAHLAPDAFEGDRDRMGGLFG